VFSLGMAPLSGFEHHRHRAALEPARLAAFRYGEHFYNFQGCATSKKVRSGVEPRYLAARPAGSRCRSC
jgi:phosphatidylglycerol lysyltransferase